MNDQILAVFYDVDGVIYNRNLCEQDAVSSVLKTECNISISNYMDHWTNCNHFGWNNCAEKSMAAEFAKVYRWQLMLKELGIAISLDDAQFLSQRYYQLACDKKYLVTGIKTVLEACHLHGLPMGIITNGFDDIQRRKLSTCGVDFFFSEIVSEKRTGFRKPDLRIFQYALDCMNVNASQAIYIGNSFANDIIPASKIGMKAIWFDCNRQLPIDKAQYVPQGIHPISSVYSMLPIIFPEKKNSFRGDTL